MSLEAPHVPFAPDPVSMVPQIQFRYLDAASFKNFDDLITGILDRLGELTAKGVMAAGAKVMDVAANAVDRVSSTVSNAYNPNFTPSASPAGERGASRDGLSQGRGRDVSDSNQLASGRSVGDTVPAQGRAQYEVASVSMTDIGQLHANVSFGKGPVHSQGMGV